MAIYHLSNTISSWTLANRPYNKIPTSKRIGLVLNVQSVSNAIILDVSKQYLALIVTHQNTSCIQAK